MQRLFTTDEAAEKDKFRLWRDFCIERLTPLICEKTEDGPFAASLDGAPIGGTLFSKMSFQNTTFTQTADTIRHPNSKLEALWVNLFLSGSACSHQNGFSSRENTHDIAVRDSATPLKYQFKEPSSVLIIEMPRARLEGMLGSSRNFAGLTVDGNLPTATLARAFLRDLMRVSDRLTPDAAERMASVGIDLVVASIAERMATETPKALHGTLTVQRAKAYIEANLGDTDLDPQQVAAAAGVSVRHMHALFRERGRNIADHIWQRRLETAAQRLSDPATLRVPLGDLAYGCGFSNQSHFSRRFRDRYGMSPRDYRHAALSQRAQT